MKNVDTRVTDGFGDEWSRFDQSTLSAEERERIFEEYFAIFPWSTLPPGAIGADCGCGSGRWAAVVAPRVGRLICVDASQAALETAKRNLRGHANCSFELASLDSATIRDESLDFAYCLGVLHHIPDTQAALAACVRKLKSRAPMLVYLYYRFDNRPAWYRGLWVLSSALRAVISRLPYTLRYLVSQFIAVLVYWPLARLARQFGRLGLPIKSLPLSYYADKSIYVMRTDALDRFGTRLEKRFTRSEIVEMMTHAGLDQIVFSETPPFWCAVGFKA